MTITGQVGGGGLVWGTDIYTEDSVIARAAVHAGVIKNGETKKVFIRILTGISKHDGSERNGETTLTCGGALKSYEFIQNPE